MSYRAVCLQVLKDSPIIGELFSRCSASGASDIYIFSHPISFSSQEKSRLRLFFSLSSQKIFQNFVNLVQGIKGDIHSKLTVEEAVYDAV